eukprot:3368948-Amphidinium_carterae.3
MVTSLQTRPFHSSSQRGPLLLNPAWGLKDLPPHAKWIANNVIYCALEGGADESSGGDYDGDQLQVFLDSHLRRAVLDARSILLDSSCAFACDARAAVAVAIARNAPTLWEEDSTVQVPTLPRARLDGPDTKCPRAMHVHD